MTYDETVNKIEDAMEKLGEAQPGMAFAITSDWLAAINYNIRAVINPGFPVSINWDPITDNVLITKLAPGDNYMAVLERGTAHYAKAA
jgi:hypothetical protein